MNLTTSNRQRIVASLVKCISTGSMEYLTAQAYRWIRQQPGFIAHYNYSGFKDYYSRRRLPVLEELREEILTSAETCHSTHINTSPAERYHTEKLWNAHTMVALLKALGLKPHGREPVVTPERYAIEHTTVPPLPA